MIGAKSKLNDPMVTLVLINQPEEIVEIDAPIFGDDGACHQHFKDQIPADHPRDDLTDGGVGEGVGGSRNRNHGREFGVAHYGRPAYHAGDEETDDHGRTRMEGCRLRADGKDTRADGHGHAHNGQIPPGQVSFQGAPRLLCFRQRLLDGFLT